MSSDRKFLMAGTAVVLLAGAALPATAAENAAINVGDLSAKSNFTRDRNVTVLDRPRPSYDAAGVRAGSFLVYPRLITTVEGNDNVFAQKTNTESDTIWHVRPEVTLASDWNRHSLSAYARGVLNRYSTHGTENTDDYNVGANGRIDVTRGSNISGGVSYNRLTEPRTAPDSPTGAIEPTRYAVTSGNLAAMREFNRLKLAASLQADKYNYDDVPTAIVNAKIDEDYRDRTVTALSGRADYAVSPDTALFLEVIGNKREYRLGKPAVTLARDSEGLNAYVGANFELTAVARGEVGVGYMKQNYKDPTLKDVQGFGARAKVEWFPSQLTTVTITGGRSIEESASKTIASYISNDVGIRVDHELLRNVILSANVGGSKDEYQGSTREDKVTQAGLRGTYLLNRNVGVTAGYAYEKRTTSGLPADRGAEYKDNRFSAALTLQF